VSEADRAVACFQQGYLCSQAVLSTYAPALGLDREVALVLAQGFGGGMGRLGEVCGALTGAFMVLGLRYGSPVAADQEVRDAVYARVSDLAEHFRARHGAIRCRELLGCDVSTPEGLQTAREQGLFATVCPGLVRAAAELLEQMLAG
jgi:C_GCAxxG_C_C family probable redox protein